MGLRIKISPIHFFKKSLCTCLILCLPIFTVKVTGQNFEQIEETFVDFHEQHCQEKLYLHTDKQVYVTGEMLWFKAYLLNAENHRFSDLSKVLYVDLIDHNQTSVLREIYALDDGESNGSLFLPTSLQSGTYKLRAYTRWMRNIDEAFFFTKDIPIINPFRNLANGAPSRSDKMSMQFFPEGGDLIEGLSNKIAFQALDSLGRGMEFTGLIVDQDTNIITRIRPHKFGIGNFELSPMANKTYTAMIVGDDSAISTYSLPQAVSVGLSLSVDALDPTFVHLSIEASKDYLRLRGRAVMLLVHCRGKLLVREELILRNGQVDYQLQKDQLPAGITHITVFDDLDLPQCERLVFNKPQKLWTPEVTTDKEHYAQRDRVSVKIKDNGEKTAMPKSSMSMTVYLNDQLQMEQERNIVSYVLLESDLKGFIEHPLYYLINDGKVVDQAIDNLMLTHGWRRFLWRDILGDSLHQDLLIPEYRTQLIKGTIKGAISDKPVRNQVVYLSLPSRYPRTFVAESDENGVFHAEILDPYNYESVYVMPEDTTADYRIEIMEPFPVDSEPLITNAHIISKNMAEEIVNTSVSMQIENAYREYKNAGIASIKLDTTDFYGFPDERYYLDEYTRFTVMEEVLREYVHGVLLRKQQGKFIFKVIDPANQAVFDEDPLILLDGVPVFDADKIMKLNPLTIERIDVVTHKYFKGSKTFPGIVSFHSYNGDLPGLELNEASSIIKYYDVNYPRAFYSPVYNSPEKLKSRIPDYRTSLYWNPNVRSSGPDEIDVSFYTSDIGGTFMIVLEGLTANGTPYYATKEFTVSKAMDKEQK